MKKILFEQAFDFYPQHQNRNIKVLDIKLERHQLELQLVPGDQ